jgi:signal transduction histidine kinase
MGIYAYFRHDIDLPDSLLSLTRMDANELIIANKELAFQNEERKKRAEELILANRELVLQNKEKEALAAELMMANQELAFQNEEREKRAAELIIANEELVFQNSEKENRAAELIIANKELKFQNQEKEKRAAELVVANEELAFQNQEKENRASELVIANKELIFQNEEKEKRAAELAIANKELAFQNTEKEKRALELMIAHKELESFSMISNHDLQEPLRKIQTFISIIAETEFQNLSERGKEGFNRIKESAGRMRALIDDIILYSDIKTSARNFEYSSLKPIAKKVVNSLSESIARKQAVIEIEGLGEAYVIPSQFQQLLHHLLQNSLKFSSDGNSPHIILKSRLTDHSKANHRRLLPGTTYCHISITDNGIGFEPRYRNKIFDVFQQLNHRSEYAGTGIGLAIAKRIVENHHGLITAEGKLDEGATFDIYIPDVKKEIQ